MSKQLRKAYPFVLIDCNRNNPHQAEQDCEREPDSALPLSFFEDEVGYIGEAPVFPFTGKDGGC